MYKNQRLTRGSGNITHILSTFILKRQKVLSIINFLVFIVVIHFILNLSNNAEPIHTHNTDANIPVRTYTRTPVYKQTYEDSIPVKQTTRRPLRIGDYEDMLRNMPAEDCKCFKRHEPVIHSRDTGRIDAGTNITSKENITTLQPIEECMKRRFPRAMVVGMTKGGTTALMTFLNAHPGVAARTKYPLDTRYFNYYIKTKDLEWYRHLLPCSYSNQITIEKSTEYFFTPHCSERIRKFDPTMKIIIAVRDPIVRALSQYLMWKGQASFRVGNKTFEQTVTIENSTQLDKKSRLLVVSNYQKHMKAWIKNFNLNQILFVDGHNFVSNPTEEINKVEDFLGIERYFTREMFAYNSTKGKYCLSLPGGKIDCLDAKKGMAHPSLDKRLRKKLETYFKPLNELFFNMIQRRFDWGY